jgi:hypothetical protein
MVEVPGGCEFHKQWWMAEVDAIIYRNVYQILASSWYVPSTA